MGSARPNLHICDGWMALARFLVSPAEPPVGGKYRRGTTMYAVRPLLGSSRVPSYPCINEIAVGIQNSL